MHSDRDLRDQLLNALGVSPDSALRAGPAGKASASTADHTGAAQPGPDRQDAGRTHEDNGEPYDGAGIPYDKFFDRVGDKVGGTLTERGERYGDFTDNAAVSQRIKDAMMYDEGMWARLNYVQREALSVIAQKFARILNGDPNYRDNWHDIQGYARLAEERCRDR